MPPRVSILTVCRNDAESLPRCLAGVAAQDWPDLEHVVQDGASTDGTLALLRAHAQRVDVRLASEADGGIHDAFVRAVRRATGDIVGFSWADEALLPGAVRRAVEVLEWRPEIGGIYGGVIETDGDGHEQQLRTWPDWSFEEVFLYRLVPPVCATFLRRRVLEERFLPVVEAAGDCFEWILWITVGSAFPLLRIPDPLTRYAQRSGQLSRQLEVVDDYPARLTRVIDRLTAGNILTPELAAHAATVKAGVHLWGFEWLACECRDLARALAHLEAALAYDAQAVRLSAVPWATARALLGRGDGRWVLAALARIAARELAVPGVSLLRGLAHAQQAEPVPAETEAAVLAMAEAPELAGAIAGVIRGLITSGLPTESERTLAFLARLATQSGPWRLAFATVLAELERFEEALAIVDAAPAGAASDAAWHTLHLRLELALCLRTSAIRSTIGELAGRGIPIPATESATIARELAHLIGGRLASAADLDAGGVAAILTVAREEAKRQRFAHLGAAIDTFAGAALQA
jgi:glycosyltransferase